MDELPLNEELERLKLNALAEFAAGAGHEINNPLAIISGHAQLLLKETDNPNERWHLSTIISQVNRAYEMIADIRMFARPPQPQWSQFYLNDLLQTFIEKMNEKWENVSFKLEEKTESSSNHEKADQDDQKNELKKYIRSDFALLMTVLTALGKNAAEAVYDKGNVLVSVIICKKRTVSQLFESQKGIFLCSGENFSHRINQEDLSLDQKIEMVQICLEDDGPGIPEEIREQIFSPYFSGRSFGRGLGFGLSKSWQLIRQLGGRLSLTAPIHFSQGCRWVIEFPVQPLVDPNSLCKK